MDGQSATALPVQGPSANPEVGVIREPFPDSRFGGNDGGRSTRPNQGRRDAGAGLRPRNERGAFKDSG